MTAGGVKWLLTLEVNRYIGQPIYRADICVFYLYQHQPIRACVRLSISALAIVHISFIKCYFVVLLLNNLLRKVICTTKAYLSVKIVHFYCYIFKCSTLFAAVDMFCLFC